MADTSLTVFTSKYDNKTHKRMDFNSFDEFEKMLYELSSIKYTKKEDAPLISPATFATDDDEHESKKKEPSKRGGPSFYHRKNINVIDWAGWCALDVDTWVPKKDLKEEINERFSSLRFCCYSTASSVHGHPKFRLVFPMSVRLPSNKIRAFWHALALDTELEVDPQCKDLSRMYYVPANYQCNADPYNFIFSNYEGAPIDPIALMKKHPMPERKAQSFFENLPENVQAEIIAHRKQQLTNNNITWNSYRDCPFWPKRLAQEYMVITDSGWYHKMYQIMVACASQAIRRKYPITAIEIAQLVFEFDADTGGWYKDRPLEAEANRALEFVYKNG